MLGIHLFDKRDICKIDENSQKLLVEKISFHPNFNKDAEVNFDVVILRLNKYVSPSAMPI